MPDTTENSIAVHPEGSPMKFWLGVFESGWIVAAGLFGLDVLRENAAKEEAVRKGFMTKCIEFHSAYRCDEFWRYGRLDLAQPKGG